jgi:hypothetical protein
MATSAWSFAALILFSFISLFACDSAALATFYWSRYFYRSLSLLSSSIRRALASAYFSYSFL